MEDFGSDENDDFCWNLGQLYVDRVDAIINLASIDMDILDLATKQKAKLDNTPKKPAMKKIKDVAVEIGQIEILDFATENNTPKKPIKDSKETHEWTKTMSRTHQKPFWTHNHSQISVWENPENDADDQTIKDVDISKEISSENSQETQKWTKTMSRTHKKPFWTHNDSRISQWEDPELFSSIDNF